MTTGRDGIDQAAVGLHDRRRRHLSLGGAVDQLPQVLREQRRERCVHLGGGGTLELAEGADHFVGERHVEVGQGF
jgi:hypothetical protein